MSNDELFRPPQAVSPTDLHDPLTTSGYTWMPNGTPIDYEEVPQPMDEVEDVLLLLEELGQLCLLISKRRFANFVILPEHPHLEKYRSWIVAQARNMVVGLASKHRSLDNETILARIEVVVSSLAQTSAAPISKVICRVYRNMGDLLSGRALQDILSEDEGTSLADLECRAMDICKGPAHLGAGDQYDLVIASHTLRTRADPWVLMHLEKMLRYDGRLTVQELDSFAHWATYIFASRPDWWSSWPCKSAEDCALSQTDGPETHVAAFGMSRRPSGTAVGKVESRLTIWLISCEPLPDHLPESTRKVDSFCTEQVSTIAERIINHLKKDGYRVKKCTSTSQAIMGQDVISVQSVDIGCATVVVATQS